MVEAFDRIVIDVPVLAEAVAQYRLLFGIESLSAGAAGTGAAWLGLPNTVIELRQRQVAQPRIAATVFRGDSLAAGDSALANPLGLELYSCDGAETGDFRRQSAVACCPALAVDHLVLRTGDADACVALFSGQLGIRLALDRTVPEWGGRMLFFRAGKLTLEVIESTEDRGAASGFWGIAYQCPDIEVASASIRSRGVAVTAVRDGRKPGTRVATVKSHCLDIPTLLIEPAT